MPEPSNKCAHPRWFLGFFRYAAACLVACAAAPAHAVESPATTALDGEIQITYQAVPSVPPLEMNVDIDAAGPAKVIVTPGFRYKLAIKLIADEFVGSTITGIGASCGCLLDGDAQDPSKAPSAPLRIEGNALRVRGLIAAPQEACALEHNIRVTVKRNASEESVQVVRRLIIVAAPQAHVQHERRLFPKIDITEPRDGDAKKPDVLCVSSLTLSRPMPTSSPAVTFTGTDAPLDGLWSWALAYHGERNFSGALIFPFYIEDGNSAKLVNGYVQVANRGKIAVSPQFVVITAASLKERSADEEIATLTITGRVAGPDPLPSASHKDACDFVIPIPSPDPANVVLSLRNSSTLKELVAKSSVINLWIIRKGSPIHACVPLIIK